MADDITLSGATRTNLLSLQRTTDLIDRTQNRLSTGLEVNSAIDDALSFFQARNLNSRASDLSTIKDGISEGIQVLTAATEAIESVEEILQQAKAIATSARSTSAADTSTRQKLASQFNELRSQIDHLVNDASYNGTNLIKSGADTLTVKFSESTTASERRLVVEGDAVDASALNISSQTVGTGATTASAWTHSGTYISTIDNAINDLDSALTTVRDTAQTFGTNASLLEIRRDFTENLINTLETGAADLVNADLNEESANLLSLQTRQQLGTISLSIAQQSEQAVLRLF
ncbi:MAG: flagellin [Rhodospirillaceae bacterium]